jgi:hypothetical protein
LTSVQARHCDRPRPVAKATWQRRAGTLTIFCVDLLHDLDLRVALGNQLLQPRILGLQLLQAPHVVGLKRPKPLPPSVDRLLGDAVPLGDN